MLVGCFVLVFFSSPPVFLPVLSAITVCQGWDERGLRGRSLPAAPLSAAPSRSPPAPEARLPPLSPRSSSPPSPPARRCPAPGAPDGRIPRAGPAAAGLVHSPAKRGGERGPAARTSGRRSEPGRSRRAGGAGLARDGGSRAPRRSPSPSLVSICVPWQGRG